MPTKELAGITPKPIIEGMPNVDVNNEFAEANVHSGKTMGSAGRLSWLSKSLFGKGTPAAYSKITKASTVSFPGEDENTAQLPQPGRM
jgi:hypothetical protein